MKKVIKWLDINLEALLGGILFFAMLGLIVLQITLRNVFNGGLQWGEEVSRFLYVWVCYIGIAYGVRMNSHITITAVTKLLPMKVRKFLLIAVQVIFLTVLIVLLRGAITNSIKIAALGSKASTMNVTENWMFLAAPVGYSLAILRIVQNLIYKIRRYNASWEIFIDLDGNYSGAIDTFCYPQDVKEDLRQSVTEELLQEAEKYKRKPRKGGTESC